MIEKFRRYELKWMDEMEYNSYMELSFRSVFFPFGSNVKET